MSDQQPTRWAGATEAVAREVMRQGEEYLKAQLQCAIAADQRAMQVTAAAVALAAAVLAGSAVVWPAGQLPRSIIWGLIVGEGMLFLAAACAVVAARPVMFYLAGSHPEQWTAADFERPFELSLGEQADHYQKHIGLNAKTLNVNGRWLMAALCCLGAAPFVTAIVWWAVGAWVAAAPAAVPAAG